MRVLLVQASPENTMTGQTSRGGTAGMLRLSLYTVDALTPPSHDVVIVDQRLDPIPFDTPWDLVGISVLTPEAINAYRISAVFRSRGVKVVLGGYHPTLNPDDAEKHADALVLGDAEPVWHQVLHDAATGKLRRRYPLTGIARCAQGKDIVPPNRTRMAGARYSQSNVIQTSRGCSLGCSHCSVCEFYANQVVRRDIPDVMADISEVIQRSKMDRWQRIIPSRPVLDFADDNLATDLDYTDELLRKLPKGVSWHGQVTPMTAMNDRFLQVAAESGCRWLFVGFESITGAACGKAETGAAQQKLFAAALNRCHHHGISVFGSFIFGSDKDTYPVFNDTLRLASENNLDAAMFNVLTPFPGTQCARQLERESRILSSDWGRYNALQSVFLPKHMTPFELEYGVFRCYSEFYRLRACFRRSLGTRKGIAGVASRLAINLRSRDKMRRIQWQTPPRFKQM